MAFPPIHTSIVNARSWVENPNNGTCGNCGKPAINAFETICNDCCDDLGITSFPHYTYPSELTHNSFKHKELRMFFFHGIHSVAGL